jgi:UDP-N-acetyl-D-glucosamine dehydrogenase
VLSKWLAQHPEHEGQLTLSTDFSPVGDSDVVIVCVPTPLTTDRNPDLSHVLSAALSISPHLTPGQLISLESSTYPGTTEGAFITALKTHLPPDATASIYVCYSPERLNPGGDGPPLEKIPKLIAGIDAESTALGRAFYSLLFAQVHTCSTPAVAELSKLFENTFRYVNIALVEELALLCDGLRLDPWEVLDAASSKPFGFMRFEPGLGPGGHCIPVDPFYLDHVAREANVLLPLLHTSQDILEALPRRWLQQIEELLETAPAEDAAGISWDVYVLGLTYKADIADARYSQALELVRLVAETGRRVAVFDPYLRPPLPPETLWVEVTPRALRAARLTIVAVDHEQLPYQQIGAHSRVILDIRNTLARRNLLDTVRCPIYTR